VAQPLDQWFLDILVCPETKAPLVLDGDFLYSSDPKTRRRYAIKDGIPNMLIEESEVVSEDEYRQVMTKHGKQVEQVFDG